MSILEYFSNDHGAPDIKKNFVVRILWTLLQGKLGHFFIGSSQNYHHMS